MCGKFKTRKPFSQRPTTHFLTGLGSGFQLNKFEQVHVVGVAVRGGSPYGEGRGWGQGQEGSQVNK